MSAEIFSALPRIANAVFCQPWMIRPSFHTDVLVPRLLAAVENPDRHQPAAWGGRREPTAEEKEAASNEKLCLAAKTGDWLVTDKNRRAKIPYNCDSATMLGQVNVTGIIGKGLSAFDMDCGGVCVDQLTAALDHLAELGARSVAIHFDTPGGTVTGVPETAAYMADYSANTVPLHAFTDTMCCSAGYYLAASCATFAAAPTAEIGSIGVYSALFDTSGYYEKAGIKAYLLASGWAKGQGMRGVPISAEFIAAAKDDVMRHAARFWSHIIDHRGEQIAAEAAPLDLNPAVHAMNIMQGQHWSTMDAPCSLYDATFPNRASHLRQLARSAA